MYHLARLDQRMKAGRVASRLLAMIEENVVLPAPDPDLGHVDRALGVHADVVRGYELPRFRSKPLASTPLPILARVSPFMFSTEIHGGKLGILRSHGAPIPWVT